MTEEKKPPKRPPKRAVSAVFVPFRPSLSPGPAARLPPPKGSIASMRPVNPRAAEPGPEAEVPLEAPHGSLAHPSLLKAPQIAVPDAADTSASQPQSQAPPADEPAPPEPLPSFTPPKSSLAPPSLQRYSVRPGSWRPWLALVAVSLVAVAFVVARSWRGEVKPTGSTPSAHVGVFSVTFDVRQFQRGSIHTHTTRSDGHESPREVALWYREHGYQFISITDHNVLVDPAELADLESPAFALVPGEEISDTVGPTPVHVLGLCIDHLIQGGRFDTPLQALNAALADVRAQNGFPVVNHPNFSWALGITDIAPLTGEYGLEIWSGHPEVHSLGDGTRPSHETIWDELLTRGRRVTAVAVDDVHTLVALDGGSNGLPGRAWIETFGDLGRGPLCDALRGGRFYGSSGIVFRRIRVEAGRLTVWVDSAADTVMFVGSATQTLDVVAGDKLAQDADGFAASYALRGGETYVRVHARAPDGTAAWTQPCYTNP